MGTTMTKKSISGSKWQVRTITTGQVAEMLKNLPAAQAVRGSVWKSEARDQLVKDIVDGLYVPPLVLAGDADKRALTDGQQRSRAIAAAVEAKKLTGAEEILLAIDAGRTVEESFRVLNIGVPVGVALVAAMSYDVAVRDAVLALASHKVHDCIKWSDAQVCRSTKSELSSALLAISAGWQSPESSAKACNTWLSTNADKVTEDAIARSMAVLDKLYAVLPAIKTASVGKSDDAKSARKALSEIKKKSLFMTTCACILAGSNAEHTVKALARPDLLKATPYTVQTPSGNTQMVANWTVGGGSSGSNAEYNQRFVVLRAAAAKYPTVAHVAAEVAAAADVDAAKAAAAAEMTAADKLAAAVGI